MDSVLWYRRNAEHRRLCWVARTTYQFSNLATSWCGPRHCVAAEQDQFSGVCCGSQPDMTPVKSRCPLFRQKRTTPPRHIHALSWHSACASGVPSTVDQPCMKFCCKICGACSAPRLRTSSPPILQASICALAASSALEESQRATDPARAQTHGFQPQCWLRWMANSVATLDLTAVSLRWI